MRRSQDTPPNARALRRLAAALLGVAFLVPAVSCAASDPHADAVGILVDRGMEREVAGCTVGRLEARGVDLDSVEDGLVDPSEHPEVIEAVAACAVVLAADDERPVESP